MFEALDNLRTWISDPVTANNLGHAGYALIALGMVLLARKNILGWISRMLGGSIWLLVGWGIDMSSIWSWGMLFLVVEVYGFRSWQKDRKVA